MKKLQKIFDNHKSIIWKTHDIYHVFYFSFSSINC